MALPKWITPAGDLGIIPELEYYEFTLDAYDASAGSLVYSRISGRLPLGIQVVSTGRLQGIPVSELGGDQNVEYVFTVRVKNTTTGGLSDRTFNITITNVAPPIITPKSNTNILTVLGTGDITANIGNYITQASSGANARVIEAVTNSKQVTVSYTTSTNRFILGSGNIQINGSSVNAFPSNLRPTEYNLGLYLDGSVINSQLEAIEFTPGAELTWTLKSGDLPGELTLSPSGLLSGIVYPVPSAEPGTSPRWDKTTWSYLGWDFTVQAVQKTFTFTVEVFDGVNYDQSTYRLQVYPRSSLTADNDDLPVDTTLLGTGVPLTIDAGSLHNPIIVTTQANLVPVRQGSYFSFQIEAIDIDGDDIDYSVPALVNGAYDEQAFSNISLSYPYVAGYVTNDTLSTGVFPKALVSSTSAASFVGNIANLQISSSFSSATLTWSNVYAGVMTVTTLISGTLSLGQEVVANGIVTGTAISAFSNSSGGTGTYIVSAPQTLANTIISTRSDARFSTSIIDTTGSQFIPGDTIKIINPSNRWQLATVTTEATIRLTGNTVTNIVSGNILTQESSLANATVTSVGSTTGTLSVFGSAYSGFLDTLLPTYQITFSGPIIANVGEYITQTISNANARITTSNVSGTIANVIYISGNFLNGNAVASSNVQIRGISVAAYPTANVKDIYNVTITANIGDVITQIGYTGNATVTANVSDVLSIPVSFDSGTFNIKGGNIRVNGVDANVWINEQTITSSSFAIAATVGQYITQPSSGANAVIIANVVYGNVFNVQFLSNNFATGSGNIVIAGANVNAYPSKVVANIDVTLSYNTSNTFDINSPLATGIPKLDGANLTSNITSLVSVGVSLGALAVEGTVGFDSNKFDQGVLSLPAGLVLDTASGWITGYLPSQSLSRVEYEFEILAFKKNDATYQDSEIFTLEVLGDLNNTIDWITDSDLGTITTGKVSDLFVYAISPLGKTIYYELASVYPSIDDVHYQKLPQGLDLTLDGLLSGRVSFEVFSLDAGQIQFDVDSAGTATTSFDFTFTFTVTARDAESTISTDKTFTLRVVAFDKRPYENLYLKALPNRTQRTLFQELMNDKSIFPIDKIYRLGDPWFGLAPTLRTLFLAGLSPSTSAEYTQAASTNHFVKRLTFGNVKTAQVLDDNFNIKYEVVYLEVKDANTNAEGDGPVDTQYPQIITPYYDKEGNEYTVAYPNSFDNMSNVMINSITYQDKGVLPDWMTSRQDNGRQLGFVYGAVLAYTKPNESALIAYRLNERNFKFNSIDFSIDRYQLDNIYTTNFDIAANAFITSSETTFDRYPSVSSTLTSAGTVDYAISTQYDLIHNHTKADIIASGGLDGVTTFKDGDTLVFAQQEFTNENSTIVEYNTGWANASVLWDQIGWAFGTSIDSFDYAGTGTVEADDDVQVPFDPTLTPPNTATIVYNPNFTATGYDLTPGQKWDQANYIPGFNEYNLGTTFAEGTAGFPASPSDGDLAVVNDVAYAYDSDSSLWRLANQRVAVWQININDDNIVTLSLVRGIDYYDTLYVRKGFRYGGTNIYFDPIVKTGLNIPNYSIIPQQIETLNTKFDGNGTRFLNYRDSYNVPEQGDKYIKFTKSGVFT